MKTYHVWVKGRREKVQHVLLAELGADYYARYLDTPRGVIDEHVVKVVCPESKMLHALAQPLTAILRAKEVQS